jgi:outer membrane protein assembly factor BamB
MTSRPLGRLLPLVLASAACATSPYQRAGNPADVGSAVARSRPPAARPANAQQRYLAFLVLGGASGPRLAAYDLDASKTLWTQPTEVTSRIAVGSQVLVHGVQPPGAAANTTLVARDIATGSVLWQYPLRAPQRSFGYAVDGDAVFVVVQTVGATQKTTTADLVALDARTGAERWRHKLPSGRVGGPAARGGVVAIPIESQYVFLLDAANGAELAQVLSTQEAATFVRALPEGLFFGSRGVFLLAPSTSRGSREAPGYLRARLPAFVRPSYWYDMYRPEQVDYSAIDRNRILWRATVDGDRARFRDDVAVVHDYRFFFAFDAGSGTLRWANQLPSDAVGSADTGGSILFATASGELGAFDVSTGARSYQAQLPGEVVRAATFDAEGFAPVASAKPPAVVSTLIEMIADPDKRFPELKVFVIEELGRQPGNEVSPKLLEVLTREGLPPLAYQKAGEALVARRDATSADTLAAALRLHADYAEARQAPPVELLAKAVAALGPNGRLAAPELVKHLRLPDTSSAAAAQIANALAATGASDVGVPALRDFLTMYRADPAFEGDPTPLVAAAEALLKLGGPGDRELLLFVSAEPRTSPGLRAHLHRALGETAPAKLVGAAP